MPKPLPYPPATVLLHKEQETHKAFREKKYIRKLYTTLRCHYAAQVPQGEPLPAPLQHQTPEQLAVAVILSAQCTDKRVNMVTPALFARFPDLFALAEADTKEVEELIYSTGFYKNKAAHLVTMAQEVCTQYAGHMPQDFDQLTKLAGIGRKTANVIMNQAFGKAEGIVVDTHVLRLSKRLGMSTRKNAVSLEKDLMSIWPKEYWLDFSLLLIFLGREYCIARSPHCSQCLLRDICPKQVG